MTAAGAIEARPPSIATEAQSLVFTALSDATRRAIIERLASNGPMTVGRLSEPFAVSAPAISRHLRVLEMAGLVTRSVDRQWRICTLELDNLKAARAWLDRVVHTGT
ncbi:ArsR/SmtB family transcription factor [Pelagibacterium xiamenense]|uniref:ArsR/SmtB family transcription factor n=1 Tax=Pelagibacterium xiamenense TaxID=2901140 RepID=UPI001E575662|nr:metalloregulator ArsR/SmtB family transcription factor [Pelagibacterium xiamenense]MCD7060149.1 metalloregulator ArsR/SmtB family transcription factor [Pelagibacterium xiamenense]